jgi:hypothetical protein
MSKKIQTSNIDMSENFDLEKLQKLYEEDSKIENFSKIKKEDIQEIIKTKSLKSKEYMMKRVFKLSSDEYAYVTDGKLIIQQGIKNIERCIPKPLLQYFQTSPIFYKKDSNPKMKMIDHEKRILNMFPQMEFKKKKIEVTEKQKKQLELWYKFLDKVICDGKKDKKHFMMAYIKSMLYNRRTYVIPFLHGKQGHGKSLFIQFITTMLGLSRCQGVDMECWSEKFSSFVDSKQFLYTEETVDIFNTIIEAQYEKAINKMKTICTESTASIRAMRKDLETCANFVNIIFGSNNMLPYKELKGRRFRLFKIKQLLEPQEYSELAKLLKDNSFIQVLFNEIYDCEYEVKDFQKFDLEDDKEIKMMINDECASQTMKYLNKIIGNLKDGQKIKCKTFEQSISSFCTEQNLRAPKSTKIYDELTGTNFISLVNPQNVKHYKFENVEELKKMLRSSGIEEYEEDEKNTKVSMVDVMENDEVKKMKEIIANLKKELKEKDEIIEKQQKQIEDIKTERTVKKVKKTPKEKDIEKFICKSLQECF